MTAQFATVLRMLNVVPVLHAVESRGERVDDVGQLRGERDEVRDQPEHLVHLIIRAQTLEFRLGAHAAQRPNSVEIQAIFASHFTEVS